MYVGGQQCNKIVSEIKIELKAMAESEEKRSAENSPSAAAEESMKSEGKILWIFMMWMCVNCRFMAGIQRDLFHIFLLSYVCCR